MRAGQPRQRDTEAQRQRASLCLCYFVCLCLFLCCSDSSWGGVSLRDGLIGYWPYDGDTLDYSGLGNHGSIVGNPTFVAGKLGLAALQFDGNDYVRMDGVSDDITNNDITMSAWVKTTDTTESDWFSVNTAGGGNVILFCINNRVAVMWDGPDNRFEGYGTTVVTDGQWHILTYVRSGSIGYIYVDGIQENTHTANFSFSATDRWSIAQEWDGDTPSDFLTGTVDEVALWDRALTVQEVAYLYNNGKGNVPTAGPYVEITESDGNSVVQEGGAADSYEVVLKSKPTADVRITATPGDGQIDLGNGPGAVAILEFTVNNGLAIPDRDWNLPQMVKITAVDDSVYEGKAPHTTIIAHTAVSADQDYNGIGIGSVEVTVVDNELTCGDWGYLPSDLNRDCYVDLLDFAIFAQQWLQIGNN